ncbi:hypothetical protein ACPOL_6790 (plasmid) [Acidisarcina polymorpha]|uniref:Uncharacterized protein n=1 Tax=Acidisarcina polymorpha TaxID=2211140 RepID=A0A2Z5GAR0_9BACT|nr:hypothetical protein ACPOL_6790 [Acidisarcina polymorpha]
MAFAGPEVKIENSAGKPGRGGLLVSEVLQIGLRGLTCGELFRGGFNRGSFEASRRPRSSAYLHRCHQKHFTVAKVATVK